MQDVPVSFEGALRRAQAALDRSDSVAAEAAFSDALDSLLRAPDEHPPINNNDEFDFINENDQNKKFSLSDSIRRQRIALALLSRAACRIELARHDDAVLDCERILAAPDVPTPSEIFPSVRSAHAAAANRIIQVCERTGNKTKLAAHRKLCKEIIDSCITATKEARARKTHGNTLFRNHDLIGALAEYEAALDVSPVLPMDDHAALLSNASLVAIKMGDVDKAEMYADACLDVHPKWSKAWYRRGAVAMERQNYTEAVHFYQSALKISPDDAEIKRACAEASQLAEKTRFEAGGLSRQVTGMLMDLQYNSWDFRTWYHDHGKNVKRVSLGFISDITGVPPAVIDAMRVRYPMYPDGELPAESELAYDLKDMDEFPPGLTRFVVPSDPLLTALVIKRLLVQRDPSETNWSFAWTLNAPPTSFPSAPTTDTKSDKKHQTWPHFSTFVAKHNTYAWLVDHETKRIVDFIALWETDMIAAESAAAMMLPEHRDGIALTLGAAINTDHTEPESHPTPSHSPIYICQDDAKYIELLGLVYSTQEQIKPTQVVHGDVASSAIPFPGASTPSVDVSTTRTLATTAFSDTTSRFVFVGIAVIVAIVAYLVGVGMINPVSVLG